MEQESERTRAEATTQEESNTVGTSGTGMVSEETRSGEVEHSAHATAVEGGTESEHLEQPKHGASMSEHIVG